MSAGMRCRQNLYALFQQMCLAMQSSNLYNTYITIFYLMSGVILASVVGSVWVGVLMRKDDGGNGWVKR